MATNIDLINAALTRTGNDPITSLADGTTEASIAAQNYDAVVEAELAGNRWKWATKTAQITRITGDPDPPWQDAYQLPSDLFLLRTIQVDGVAVPYERQSNKILCNYDADHDVFAYYTYKPAETYWPAYFRELVIRRLEAVFLRAIGERFDEASKRDNKADEQQAAARLMDSQGETPRNPYRSTVLSARGGWPVEYVNGGRRGT